MFPQRISLDLSLSWYRCNRQYVQGSGKLVLKLSGFRATALPHLHLFHGHGASLPEEGVWQHQPQRHIMKRRKAMAGGAGCSLRSRGTLETACWIPTPPASPPSRWACSFYLLGACQQGAPKAPSWGWRWVSWMPGNPRPCSRSEHCGQGSASLNG